MRTLYRAYRPHRFGEVVGQEVAVTLLRNAVLRDRLAHAYLFAGPRGVGKTSLAKILAQAVNCRQLEGGEPCGVCPECRQSALHTVEMDAASNRGIDEIRDLREKVRFAPAIGRKRTYILDEAHMLTAEAFNALLKTLEEPPDHLLFILATTEPERIPDTVLSRCQKVPFRRLTPAEIAAQLAAVAEREGLALAEPAALFLARLAEGSLRDGLALLDMVATFGDGPIDLAVATRAVGGVHPETVSQLFQAVRAEDGEGFLKLYRALLADGADPEVLAEAFLEELRRVAEEEVSRRSTSARRWVEALRQMVEARHRMRLATEPELVFEAAALSLLVPAQVTAASAGGRASGSSEGEQAAHDAGSGHLGKPRRGPPSSGLLDLVRARVRSLDLRTHALLERVELVEEDDAVALVFDYPSHRVLAEQEGHLKVLQAALRDILGREVPVRFRVKEAKG